MVLANPERLFDHTWRPRHPLRPRLSLLRRVAMLLLLVVLAGMIITYSYVTDPRRVRSMADAYLSKLLDGKVDIGRASLSIFEGLRLDDVTYRIGGPTRPDSTLFHAKAFIIHYHIKDLITGKLAATQIIVIEPVVELAQDAKTRSWNFERMFHNDPRHRGIGFHLPPDLQLPQIILRDAQIAYLQVRGGKAKLVGWYNLEGQLAPGDEAGSYAFQLQSRGHDAIGPSIEGVLRTDSGPSSAQLQNFTVDSDKYVMLPDQIRNWCVWHQLQGRIDVPDMVFYPASPGHKAKFHVAVALSDGEMAVHPEEWMSNQQNRNVDFFHHALTTAASRDWISQSTRDYFTNLSTPQPVHLRHVSGMLDFNESGIQLKEVMGELEGQWFTIDGSLDGYSADAAGALTISSSRGHDLDLPSWSPTYVGSLPAEVQEIYERLRPSGSCAGWVRLVRPRAGAKPIVTGRLDILDGRFCLSDLPYPLSRATGTVLLGPDPVAQMNGIRIMNVCGHGPSDGPNADALITIDGFIGPLDKVAGVWIDVRGSNISSDPVLRHALPPSANRALELFDPAGMEEYPKFHGDFACHVVRPVGPKKRWSVDTDINVDDCEGTLVAFPYPLKHLSARLEIRDGYLNLVGAHMKRGDATLAIDGKVTWKTGHSLPNSGPYGPDLQIVAHNLPVDRDLQNALPPLQRKWLRDYGVTALLDIDGRLTAVSAKQQAQLGRDVDYGFDIKVHDGRVQPPGSPIILSDLSGRMRLTPDEMLLNDVTADRGRGTVRAAAALKWRAGSTEISASASDLLLDKNLYALLPRDARSGWDAVHPHGTIDAAFSYSDNRTLAHPLYRLEIRPRNLSVMADAVPYPLQKLSGTVTVTPNRVELADVRGVHGPATVWISGHGLLAKPQVWDLRLKASRLPVDPELRRALPSSVGDLLKALKVSGNVDVEFTKFSYRPKPELAHPADAAASAPSTRSNGGADMDFAARFVLHDDAMDLGLAAQHVQGSIDLAGLVRDGHLHRLAGECRADTLTLSGRPAGNFDIAFAQATDDPVIQITRLEGSLAGGDVGGSGSFAFPDDGPSTYDLSLVLRDADVEQLVPSTSGHPIDARLSASLEMAGQWSDPDSRRGHGDVVVHGDNMYNVPIVLGLLQITNLALPLSSPFSDASMRYTLDGQRVVFDTIDLRSRNMTMSGSGDIDFGARKVSLWLVTDNPTLISLPILGPLIHGAKQELLKIHVSGTIQQPHVSASSLNTITTTVDRVLNNGEER